MALSAIPVVPAGKVPEHIVVKIGITIAARAFHNPIAGPDAKAAPGALVTYHRVARLHLVNRFFPKWFPDRFQAG